MRNLRKRKLSFRYSGKNGSYNESGESESGESSNYGDSKVIVI